MNQRPNVKKCNVKPGDYTDGYAGCCGGFSTIFGTRIFIAWINNFSLLFVSWLMPHLILFSSSQQCRARVQSLLTFFFCFYFGSRPNSERTQLNKLLQSEAYRISSARCLALPFVDVTRLTTIKPTYHNVPFQMTSTASNGVSRIS